MRLEENAKDSALTSIVIVNFNGRNYLDECLSALKANSDCPIEIILVDNASTDGSAEYLDTHYPDLNAIKNPVNTGYASGINLGAQAAKGKYLVFLNADVIVEPNWLSPIQEFLDATPDAGAINPCILLYQPTNMINALGQNIHVTGLGFNRKLNRPISEVDVVPTRVSGLQGGAVAMRAEVFQQIGGMNEFYFLYHEDVEFSLRLSAAGYSMYSVPASRVRHKYLLHMTANKLHWLERYRWVTLANTFHTTTLIALLPFLCITEAMMFGYCLLRGTDFLSAKFKAIQWFIQNRQDIRSARAKVDSVRVRSDWQILKTLRWSYEWSQFLRLSQQNGAWISQLTARIFGQKTRDQVA